MEQHKCFLDALCFTSVLHGSYIILWWVKDDSHHISHNSQNLPKIWSQHCHVLSETLTMANIKMSSSRQCSKHQQKGLGSEFLLDKNKFLENCTSDVTYGAAIVGSTKFQLKSRTRHQLTLYKAFLFRKLGCKSLHFLHLGAYPLCQLLIVKILHCTLHSGKF